MTVACVLVTHLRARIELERNPHLAGRPAVIVDRTEPRPMVVDSLPPGAGAQAGMTLEQALGLSAETAVIEADEPAYRREFRRVLTALQAIADRVEESDLGTAYVDLDGLDRLYRGEAGLVCALMNAVPAHLSPRIGVADAKFPALVAARTAGPLEARRVPEDAGAFLAPHPVGMLPIAPGTLSGMRRLGLHTMGDAASMRAGALADQFGPAGHRAWMLSRGIDDSPFVALGHEEAVAERTSLPFPTSSAAVLSVAVDSLLRRAYARPDMRGRSADRASVECVLQRAPTWERTFRFKRPAVGWEQAARVVRSGLEAHHPPAPVEDVALTLSGLAGESGMQLGLIEEARDRRERHLVEVDRRLRDRAGGGHSLYRVVEVAPWHPAPEMRALRVPVDPAERRDMGSLAEPAPVAVREGPGHRPRAVRSGGRWRRVAGIEDTWSFDLWWMPTPLARTYHRVRLDGGNVLTLFRDRDGARWHRQSA